MTVAKVHKKRKSLNKLHFRWWCVKKWNWLILHSCTSPALAMRLCAGGCVISHTLQCGTDWQRQQHLADTAGWLFMGRRNVTSSSQTCARLDCSVVDLFVGISQNWSTVSGMTFVALAFKLVQKVLGVTAVCQWNSLASLSCPADDQWLQQRNTWNHVNNELTEEWVCLSVCLPRANYKPEGKICCIRDPSFWKTTNILSSDFMPVLRLPL